MPTDKLDRPDSPWHTLGYAIAFYPREGGDGLPLTECSLLCLLQLHLACLSQAFPVFDSSVCFTNNAQKWESDEVIMMERPEIIHHVSGCQVDIEREEPIFKVESF